MAGNRIGEEDRVEPTGGAASQTDPPDGSPGDSLLHRLMPWILLPLLLAAVFVTVTVLFSWLALAADRPQDLVRQLQQADRNSWRQAVTLVQLLRDPAHAQLRRDREMAAQLAGVLQAELDAGASEDERLRLRAFLCRALGQFCVPDVLPVLVQAAGTERSPAEIDVRRSALEALADFAAGCPEAVAEDGDLLRVLLEASRWAEAAQNEPSRDALRATAAFALGVLGAGAAQERLVELLADPDHDVRYNAATGLARHGRGEAAGVLLEMLDPEAPSAAAETSDRGRRWKRQIVLRNALRSVESLAIGGHPETARPLIAAIDRLAEDPRDAAIQRQARQLLARLQALPSPLPAGYEG